MSDAITGLPAECSRGHHCGISGSEGGHVRVAHCPCEQCECPLAPSWPPSLRPLGQVFRELDARSPMCSPEYARRQAEQIRDDSSPIR